MSQRLPKYARELLAEFSLSVVELRHSKHIIVLVENCSGQRHRCVFARSLQDPRAIHNLRAELRRAFA